MQLIPTWVDLSKADQNGHDQVASHLATFERMAYIPECHGRNSNRARHRQRQTRYEALNAFGFEIGPSWAA